LTSKGNERKRDDSRGGTPAVAFSCRRDPLFRCFDEESIVTETINVTDLQEEILERGNET